MIKNPCDVETNCSLTKHDENDQPLTKECVSLSVIDESIQSESVNYTHVFQRLRVFKALLIAVTAVAALCIIGCTYSNDEHLNPAVIQRQPLTTEQSKANHSIPIPISDGMRIVFAIDRLINEHDQKMKLPPKFVKTSPTNCSNLLSALPKPHPQRSSPNGTVSSASPEAIIEKEVEHDFKTIGIYKKKSCYWVFEKMRPGLVRLPEYKEINEADKFLMRMIEKHMFFTLVPE